MYRMLLMCIVVLLTVTQEAHATTWYRLNLKNNTVSKYDDNPTKEFGGRPPILFDYTPWIWGTKYLSGDILYYFSDGGLSAYQLPGEIKIWTVPGRGNVRFIMEPYLVFNTANSILIINRRTGVKLLEFNTTHTRYLTDSRFDKDSSIIHLISDIANKLTIKAVDVKKGNIIWENTINKPAECKNRNRFEIVHERVLMCQGFLWILDTATGGILSEVQANTGGWGFQVSKFENTFLIHKRRFENGVFLPDDLLAFDGITGTQLWQRSNVDWSASIGYCGNNIIMISGAKTVYFLDSKNGSEIGVPLLFDGKLNSSQCLPDSASYSKLLVEYTDASNTFRRTLYKINKTRSAVNQIPLDMKSKAGFSFYDFNVRGDREQNKFIVQKVERLQNKVVNQFEIPRERASGACLSEAKIISHNDEYIDMVTYCGSLE